jgi:hypothetical protein
VQNLVIVFTYCHEYSGDDQAITEVVSSSLLGWKNEERYEQEDE